MDSKDDNIQTQTQTQTQTQVNQNQIIGMVEKEMMKELEYRTEMFSKLTDSCYNKCVIKSYKEAELFMGESTCIDRCVAKYWQVTNIIGQMMASKRPPV